MEAKTTTTRISKANEFGAICLFVVVTAALAGSPTFAAILIPAGASWKYLDDGSDQGAAWRALAFDDSTWRSGRAQLGYGDSDEVTPVGYGSNSSNKFITTWFRATFTVPNPSLYRDLTISILRDDGAVVYLNGREIFRSNMPVGPVSYQTLASSNVGGTDEATFYPITVAATNLASGNNVIAVEIHQAAANSTDISFDLQLTANVVPLSIAPISPFNNASGVNPSANLSVALSDVVSGNLTVTIC